MKTIINKIKIICRNCDLQMDFEEENPRRYFLFKCKYCENRVGIEVIEDC